MIVQNFALPCKIDCIKSRKRSCVLASQVNGCLQLRLLWSVLMAVVESDLAQAVSVTGYVMRSSLWQVERPSFRSSTSQESWYLSLLMASQFNA